MAESIEKLDRNFEPLEVADGLAWYDALELGVEGRGWSDTNTPYDRLPARAQAMVRPPVWELSQRSAGMAVRFVTDAPSIAARWTLRFEQMAMSHMPASGVSGLDLYGRVDGRWYWAGVGIPGEFPHSQVTLTTGLRPGLREYLLYLPLYNGVSSVAVGVPEGATIAPAKPRDDGGAGHKPVVVYGTSIVQGGCAARAGMSYVEIMARLLDRPTINLGFSGNGPMDLEVAELLGELDPSVFVIDSLPNMQPATVEERAERFVRILRDARPTTPIVLVENITYQRAWVQADEADRHTPKNVQLREAHQRLLNAGVTGLTYVPGDGLLGADGLGTVDGTHPTDVGHLRMARALAPVVQPLIS